MIREQPHSHIQDHGNENYRRITSRSIGTPASLLTVTGNTEKIATDIHKNAHLQSELDQAIYLGRYRSQLGVGDHPVN